MNADEERRMSEAAMIEDVAAYLRAAGQDDLADTTEGYTRAAMSIAMKHIEALQQLNTVTAQRDAAVEALQWVRDHSFPMKDCEASIKQHCIAAIAAAGGTNEPG